MPEGGVLPLPQLFSVPRVAVPAGEYFVDSRAWPRTGPEISTGVSGVMRRLKLEDGLVVEIETLGHGYHEPES